MRKEKCEEEEEHNELRIGFLGGRFSRRSAQQSRTTQLFCARIRNTSNHSITERWEKLAAASATTGNSDNRCVSTGSHFV
jgi:hypothetical protein